MRRLLIRVDDLVGRCELIGVEDKLLPIEVLEAEPEDNGQDGSGDGWTSKCPDKVGILDDRCGGQSNGGCDGSHEKVDG